MEHQSRESREPIQVTVILGHFLLTVPYKNMNQLTNKHYQGYIVGFMSYHHGLRYDKTTIFSPADLGAVVPDDIHRWMCFKTFGRPEPLPDDRPVLWRSSTLEVAKKALSWYMPNRIAAWDSINNVGNPTKSSEVNNLLKFVKKAEVRRIGRASSTKRALTQEEFRLVLRIFFEKGDFQYRYRYCCMLKYQYHLIARCDDLGNFRTEDLHGHNDPRFSHFALQTKVHWSKNVLEERDCPDQIFMGSYDHDYCLLLALSVYLEIYTTSNPNSVYLFGEGEENAQTVNRIKNTFSSAIRKFFHDFCRGSASVLGTHSFRKYAATWARNNGCSDDDVNGRGRWKQTRRVVNRYLDVENQFVDAKVQAALCVGGPIKYKLLDGSGVTTDWCNEHVVPGIREYYGNDNTISDVLALPLLYACLNDDLMDCIPLTLSSRIQEAYGRIRVLDEGVNPVKKVRLRIRRLQDQLCIDEIADDDDDTNAAGNEREQNDNTNIILLQMQQIQSQLAAQFDQLQQSFNNLRSDFSAKVSNLNRNMNRIIIQPPRQATPQQRQERDDNNNIEEAAAFHNETERQQLIAQLSKTPRSLYDLWTEYQHGIGGNKAAKDFTYTERGKCKFKYCRRKVVWDCVSRHVNAGDSAVAAIKKIYDCYGNSLTVSAIINAMVKDKKTGGHPNLRI